MNGEIFPIALYAIGGCILGVLIGWSAQLVREKRRDSQVASAIQGQLDEVIDQRNNLARDYTLLRSQFKKHEAASAKQRAKLKSVLEKSKLLAKNVRILRKERENTKSKLGTLQNTVALLKQQTSDLQDEFHKTRKFYKRELLKSLQKRKDLEEEILAARAEQESFSKAVESSVLEHGSTENMVIAAQLRLGQLDVLERTVNRLETENEQLRENTRQIRRELSAREKDLAELEQLKLNNRQLVQCVEALEGSRKEHEADANRYRQKADQSEKLSDTLRLKLDDLEKNFADIEQQQLEAIEDVRNAAVVPILKKHG